VREVATNTTGIRPTIDACGGTRPIPPAGMTISIPKITANATVDTVAEGGDPTGTTAITSAYVDATVIKKAGFQRYSVELLDRSDPSFFEIMLQNLRDGYALATDAYVIAQITAGGTQATAVAATSAGIISYVSTESAAAYNATKRVATAYVAGTSQWSLLMSSAPIPLGVQFITRSQSLRMLVEVLHLPAFAEMSLDLTSMSIRTWCQQQSMRARSLLSHVQSKSLNPRL
jgi:hypothetical protein